jgi:hypothetical protein
MPKLDDGAAIAVISFAVLEVFRTYQNTAPKLSEVRMAPSDDWDVAQRLLDADVMTGMIVVLMGLAGVVLLNRKGPLVFLILTWIMVAGYYHLVRREPNSYKAAVEEGRV